METQNSKIGLLPKERPRPTDSQAELKVYDALSRQLPKGWTAWHFLRIRTDQGVEGEGDFALAIPGPGIPVLKVKGRQLEQRNGRLFQNGRPWPALLANKPIPFQKNFTTALQNSEACLFRTLFLRSSPTQPFLLLLLRAILETPCGVSRISFNTLNR